MHLVMVCVGCSFDSLSVVLLSLKQQQNLMKIMFSCISFPICLYLPQIMKKNVFYTGKLYGLTGMRLAQCIDCHERYVHHTLQKANS